MPDRKQISLFTPSTLIGECTEIWVALAFAATETPIDATSIRKDIEMLYNTLPTLRGSSGADLVGPLNIRPSLLYPIVEKLRQTDLLIEANSRVKDGRFKEYLLDDISKKEIAREADLLIALLQHILSVTTTLREEIWAS